MTDNTSPEVGVSQPEHPKVSQKAVKSPTSKDPHAQKLALAITHDRALGVNPNTSLQTIRDYKYVDSGDVNKEYLTLAKIKESVRSQHTDTERKELLEQDLEGARIKLSELPIIDSVGLGSALDGTRSKPVFQLVDTDKIVGMSFNNGKGWADENQSRKGRVAGIAKGVLEGDEAQLEEIFHPDQPNQRIKLTSIQGPGGPMYFVDDGTHRVSGSKLAGIEALPADVTERTYPSTHYTSDKMESLRWEELIKLGMIEGTIEELVSEGGTSGVKLNLQSEVLPWIRNSQTNLIRTSQMYESLYPGSLDNLPIPRDALVDPIANNYFMAGRWNEWLKLSSNSSAQSNAEKGARSHTESVAEREPSSLAEKELVGHIGNIARVADEAIVGNDPGGLQAAINDLPEDKELRRRVTEMLRLKGIPVKSRDEERQNEKTEQVAAVPYIDYEHIGKKLTLDEAKPPLAESLFVVPGMSNFFDKNDSPTLAGKLATRVYSDLMMRDTKSQQAPSEMYIEDDKGRADYLAYVQSINRERVEKGLSPFVLTKEHTSGVDDFHQNGKSGKHDFEFYFNKSRSNWKAEYAQDVRGYVTIGPDQIRNIQRDFVDLTGILYDAGIDFTAKATGYMGARNRTDNMVFYISPQDQAQASLLMKEFLSARGIGQGHVLAAMPSAQEGLSWAMDPDQTQTKVWQEVAGTTTDASFNSYVAARLMPDYLTRIADAHDRKGNREQAKIFIDEALRTKAVIDRLKPSP